MSMTSELREATHEIMLRLAIETLDLIEEHIRNVEMQGTASGHELIHGEAHGYLIRKAKQQQNIIDKLEQTN